MTPAKHRPQLVAALAAAERGWHVIPLAPDDKRPALHAEARCLRTGPCAAGHLGWEQRATSDPERVARCWQAGPYGIGLATGPSRLVVVDLDTPKHPGDTAPPEWAEAGVTCGADVLAALCERHGQPYPSETHTVRTGRGGLHLYFTAPAGLNLRNTAGKLGWKVDTRAGGGYVVAAGSTVNGRPYTTWHDVPPAPLPDWLATLLRPAPLPPQRPVVAPLATDRHGAYLDAAVKAEVDRVTSSPDDGHNNALYLASVALGQLVAGGELPEAYVTARLAQAAAQVGQGEREAARTIRSGLSAGAKRPRTVAA
ncbi:bifunctional DNA primase/polymerase [Allostreptomyces psammosilenae]|uniref:DNA primase/polymerase bifunctional N-terminal domain-containing protein n=1 Tax=Allostreptomyces psammosilenae TaxID=1892865 RepID=A0A852ZT28_9ACTN|nr:bifunctional DNA primase/polymerase [Allostreptomyces psammosilenae]NYI05576.1 hypothetical protein [Allostreptomyces psammosilenae]